VGSNPTLSASRGHYFVPLRLSARNLWMKSAASLCAGGSSPVPVDNVVVSPNVHRGAVVNVHVDDHTWSGIAGRRVAT